MDETPEPIRLRAGDDRGLHVLRWGSGRCVVLLHGLGHNGSVWRDLATHLSSRGRVLAPDTRGHGLSDWDPRGRYDVGELLEDLDLVLESCAAPPVALVGHSMGGELALRFADSRPDRVARLVLVDFGPRLREAGTSGVRSGERELATRIYAGPKDYCEKLAARYLLAQERLLPDLAHHGLHETAPGVWKPRRDPRFRLTHPGGAHWGSRGGETLSTELERALETLRCPTLVIRGRHSSVLSQGALAEVGARNPEWISTAEIPAAGHAVMLDNPGALRAATSGFLAPFLDGDGSRSTAPRPAKPPGTSASGESDVRS